MPSDTATQFESHFSSATKLNYDDNSQRNCDEWKLRTVLWTSEWTYNSIEGKFEILTDPKPVNFACEKVDPDVCEVIWILNLGFFFQTDGPEPVNGTRATYGRSWR